MLKSDIMLPIRMYTDKDAQHLAGIGKEITEHGFKSGDYCIMMSCLLRADMYFALAELCEKTRKEHSCSYEK